MPISTAEVHRIAALARLELDSESVEVFRRELQSILDYMGLLDELEVASVVAPGPEATIRDLRDDQPQPCLTGAEALANAPERAEGMFRVPRMFDADES